MAYHALATCSSSSHQSKATHDSDAAATRRLRLMSLLAIYDLLPYSIAHPPDGKEPLDIDNAVNSDAVFRCLEKINVLSSSNNKEPMTPITSTSHAHGVSAVSQKREIIRGQILDILRANATSSHADSLSISMRGDRSHGSSLQGTDNNHKAPEGSSNQQRSLSGCSYTAPNSKSGLIR